MSLIKKLNDHYLANINKPAEILHPELQDIVKIHSLDNDLKLDPAGTVNDFLALVNAAERRVRTIQNNVMAFVQREAV
jgi:hypothetical protein